MNLGAATMALPSGRKAGRCLRLTSTRTRVCKKGLTGILESIGSYDHTQATNASAIDVHLSADTPTEVLDYMTQYLDRHNALLEQVTVANREDLLDAKKNPERYKDLIIRVTGFCARFVELDEITQDEVIQRSYWT
jgi:formate C-acetyltransferase